jgi:hypothetical protein
LKSGLLNKDVVFDENEAMLAMLLFSGEKGQLITDRVKYNPSLRCVRENSITSESDIIYYTALACWSKRMRMTETKSQDRATTTAIKEYEVI